jgi:hypothetical protein
LGRFVWLAKEILLLLWFEKIKVIYAMNLELSNSNGAGISLFEQLIKAQEACKRSNHAVSDHIVDVNDMVQIGSGATKWAKVRQTIAEIGGTMPGRRRGLGRRRRGLKVRTH